LLLGGFPILMGKLPFASRTINLSPNPDASGAARRPLGVG